MTTSIRSITLVLGIALGTMTAGCASAPPPRDLDFRHMRIEMAVAAPRLDVSSLPGGKAVGAGVGAASGLGWGALAGAAGCAATGPFVAICLAAVMPATMGVGAGTGAIVGAARAETSAAIELKTRALASEIDRTSLQAMFASRIRVELRSRGTGDLPIGDGDTATGPVTAADAAANPPRSWILKVGIDEVASDGNDEFALRLLATAALRREGGPELWRMTRKLQSHSELTIGQWMSEEASALHAVIGACMKTAAEQIASELTGALPQPPVPPARQVSRANRCDDIPMQVAPKAAKV